MPDTYTPPDGSYDQPFYWIFDAQDLTDGSNALNQAQPILAGFGDFILRRTVGWAGVINTETPQAGAYQVKDRSLRYIESDPVYVQPAPADDNPVVPELLYPELSAIRFDLYNVLRTDPPVGGTFVQAQIISLSALE